MTARTNILAFPVVKRPVPVVPVPPSACVAWPTPVPEDRLIVLAEGLGFRAVLCGEIYSRRIEMSENGLLKAVIKSDAKALALTDMVMSLGPDDRTLVLFGVMTGLELAGREELPHE